MRLESHRSGPTTIPRWIVPVLTILIVAWWLSTQPPRGERGAAPTPDQNAEFEPSLPVPAEPEAASKNDVDPAAGDLSPFKTPEETPRSSKTEEIKPVPETPAASVTKKRDANPLVIANITIKDQSGRVAFKGDVDLHPTMERIDRGEKFPHRNDGSTFRNLEGRLPKKPAGYYTEYVHPTPGLNGPGPQRVVIGKNGEAFYTHDHYNSFRKVRE